MLMIFGKTLANSVEEKMISEVLKFVIAVCWFVSGLTSKQESLSGLKEFDLETLITGHPNCLSGMLNDNLLDLLVDCINVVPLHDGGEVLHEFIF